MVRYEIRKLFHRTSTRILLLLLFLANAFFVWNQQLPGSERYYSIGVNHILSLYAALPEDGGQALAALNQQNDVLFDAVISERDADTLLTDDVYSERRLFANLIERVEPIACYDSILQEIEENAETLLLTGRYDPNSFGYRNVLKSQQAYRHLADVQPQVFYSGAAELLPGGRITDLILVILCLLTGLELICAERTSGTMALSKPAYRGTLPLISAKIAAGLLIAAFGTLILYGSNLLIGFARCGTVPMNAPIQSIFGFVRSPWKITVGGYIAGFFGVKFLWAAWVTALVYTACCLGSSSLECCGLFLLIAAASLISPDTVVSLIAAGNTVALFAEYRNLNVLGWPVSSFAANIIAMSLMSVGGFGGAMILHIKISPIVSARRNRRTSKKYRVSTNLFLHETQKLLLLNGGAWVLAVLAAVQFVTYLNFDTYIDPQERLYMQYSETLSGTANLEKDEFLAAEEARFAELYTQLDEYAIALSQGRIQQEAYEALYSGIARQLESEAVFLRARNQYEQMKTLGYDYVCLTGYDRLLGTQGHREWIRQTIYLTIALIAGLSGMFSVEHETGMHFLINSAVERFGSKKRKCILAVLYAVSAAVVVYAPQVIAIAAAYGLPGLMSSAGSVPGFHISFGTVWTAFTICGVGIVLGAVGAAMLILLISGKSGSTVQTYLYSAAALLIPLVAVTLLLF